MSAKLDDLFNLAKTEIKNGDYKKLEAIVTSNKELVNFRQIEKTEKEEFSLTLLHHAVGFPPGNPPKNATDSIEVLLKNGADIEALDKLPKGSTPLQNSAGYNLIDITKLLLENGADPNSNQFHEFGMDATSLALFEAYTDLVRLLVKHGAEVTLDVAAGTGNIEQLKIFTILVLNNDQLVGNNLK